MSRLEWDKTGERLYETGADQGVLYLQEAGAYPKGGYPDIISLHPPRN